jgi:hypothetical protein
MNLIWVNRSCVETVLPTSIRHSARGDLDAAARLQEQCDKLDGWEVVLWYDGLFVEKSKEAAACLKKDVGRSNFYVRDIRALNTVRDHTEAFKASVNIYFRIDLLKVLVCLRALAQGSCLAVFSDFSIEPQEEKSLLDKETVGASQDIGVVLAKNRPGQCTPYENGWMLFSNAQPTRLYAVWDGYVARLLLAAQQAAKGLPQQWGETPEAQRRRRGKPAGPEMNHMKGASAFNMWGLLLQLLPFIEGEEDFMLPSGTYAQASADEKRAFLEGRNRDEAARLFDKSFGLSASAVLNGPANGLKSWPTKDIGIPDMLGVYD